MRMRDEDNTSLSLPIRSISSVDAAIAVNHVCSSPESRKFRVGGLQYLSSSGRIHLGDDLLPLCIKQ